MEATTSTSDLVLFSSHRGSIEILRPCSAPTAFRASRAKRGEKTVECVATWAMNWGNWGGSGHSNCTGGEKLNTHVLYKYVSCSDHAVLRVVQKPCQVVILLLPCSSVILWFLGPSAITSICLIVSMFSVAISWLFVSLESHQDKLPCRHVRHSFALEA